MLKRTLQDMFEKVNRVKLTEGWFSNKPQQPQQPLTPEQKQEEVFKAINKMADQYKRTFVANITGSNNVWTSNFDQFVRVAAKKVIENPQQYGDLLKRYPIVGDVVNRFTPVN
jgi:hypothetical protein